MSSRSKKGGGETRVFWGVLHGRDPKQIERRSGCLLVYNDINASVYPLFSTLLYYSPSFRSLFRFDFTPPPFSPRFLGFPCVSTNDRNHSRINKDMQ